MTVRALVLAMTLLSFCLGLGCLKSSTTQASSESSSKLSSSPFKSSSNSSSPEEEPEDSAYRRDVRDYAAAFAGSDGDVQAFQRDVGGIAADHGITDWERDEGTFFAIGRGIAISGVSSRRYQELAIELSNEDSSRLERLRAGYETRRLR